MVMQAIPVVEDGHCDPQLCNNASSTVINGDYFNEKGEPPGWEVQVAGCRSVPASVPIKQLLKGSMAVPWVRLRFEGDNCPDVNISPDCDAGSGEDAPSNTWDYSEITTGNISQPGCVGSPISPGCTEKCRAVIKSFQYTWGGTQSGNVCKIVIHDESGSTFDSWFWRVLQNPQYASQDEPSGIYKMKITFGWLVVGGDQDCPAQVVPKYPNQYQEYTQNKGCTDTSPTCGPQNDPEFPDWPDNPFTEPSQQQYLICSPAMWFLPMNLTNISQGAKFIYELEGRDLMSQAQRRPANQIPAGGSSTPPPTTNPPAQTPSSPVTRKTYFVDACVNLGLNSWPSCNVQFAQLDDDGNSDCPQQMQFEVQQTDAYGQLIDTSADYSATAAETEYYVDVAGQTNDDLNFYKSACFAPNGTPIACPGVPDDSESAAYGNPVANRGPLHIYNTGNKDPVGAINDWLKTVMAYSPKIWSRGKGITLNYDSTYEASEAERAAAPNMPSKGRMLVFADARGSVNQNEYFNGRKKALYIVNGGKCSPVYSFLPTIKWHWNQLAVGGGGLGPNAGDTIHANQGVILNDFGSPLGPNLQLTGSISGFTDSLPRNSQLDQGASALDQNTIAQQAHYLTNGIPNAIEAELKVQGDPSPWLCSPIYGYGRNVAIVYINPFYLSDGSDAGSNGCPTWVQRQKTPGPIGGCGTSGVCHDLLTNQNWFIEQVEHIIKEGSYITNIKVKLLTPGIDMSSAQPDTGQPLNIGLDPDAYCEQQDDQNTNSDPDLNPVSFQNDPVIDNSGQNWSNTFIIERTPGTVN